MRKERLSDDLRDLKKSLFCLFSFRFPKKGVKDKQKEERVSERFGEDSLKDPKEMERVKDNVSH